MLTLAKTKNLAAVILGCVFLTLAGCGGGSSSSSSTADPDPSGLGPNSVGALADARGFYPDAAGRYPDARGLYPDASGNYPTDDQAGMFDNDSGTARSYSTLGAIDTSANNPFFKSFGNGRTCGSCHVQGEGFSITPKGLQARFDKTNGTDPIFQTNDGATSPNAAVASLSDKRTAYSLLLSKGLIRIGLPVPTVTNDVPPKPAEFVLDSISDPYGYASAGELSLFRRPLPSTNLRFLSTVMWDGRETVKLTPADPTTYPRCIHDPSKTAANWNCYGPYDQDLMNQANTATRGHAQAAADLSTADQAAIMAFELTLFTAQAYDKSAGFLMSGNAKGGTQELTTVDYYFDINSVFNDPKTGLPPTTTKLTVMQLFGTWLSNAGTKDSTVAATRASIARGEKIFNTRTFQMTNVWGTRVNVINAATCTNCHSTPQVGSLAQPNLFALGLGDPNFSSAPDLPLYTLRKVKAAATGSGALKPDTDPIGTTVTVQDPGLAMITGKWADVGKFKVPDLRGLSMRAPYFHDGSAKTIEDTTAFYISRFKYDVPLTAQDILDLNAFLKSL